MYWYTLWSDHCLKQNVLFVKLLFLWVLPAFAATAELLLCRIGTGPEEEGYLQTRAWLSKGVVVHVVVGQLQVDERW